MNPDARETPLAAKLKERIRRGGPMRVEAYMQACLHDAEHGYYRRQLAIGAKGDFVTAPEISQVFGELVGLWCAVVWQQMGSPERINLVELGPGRGTLMRDALRVARIVPGFRETLSVHLVDSNATLRRMQEEALKDAGAALHFHSDASEALMPGPQMADGPTIVLANEFLDALPITQLVFEQGHWRLRMVDIRDDRFCFAPDTASSITPVSLPKDRRAQDGDILEACGGHALCARLLRARADLGPLAALFIDYGHAATGYGDTLQGVAGQNYISPLETPGETDLSTQVDFQSFATACQHAGLSTDGPLPQAEFLGRLGIVERASRLMAANAARASAIEAGALRLIAPSGMGSRFLAIGVRSPDLAPLPGLA